MPDPLSRILPHVRRLRGDFRVDPGRLAFLSVAALVVGAAGGLVAVLLLHLIGLITHLAYDGTVGWSLVAPNLRRWGAGTVLVPVLGGLVVGLLARYAAPEIRGHGIPEALQVILEQKSVMPARVAVVKPLASAVAIGTGGPFGAEGPIIMTGGALGSLGAQFLTVTARERRTLLVAGAAAGMSATFGAPVSAVLLAVELLSFEWSPRSFVPAALASLAAYAVRVPFYGTAPIFQGSVAPWPPVSWLAAAAVLGLVLGVLSGGLTAMVYGVEDLYRRLPLHWMWWPLLGGAVVGLGGLVAPQALGVGYPTIRALDAGQVLTAAALALLAAKAVMWVSALSSGTSGGVLAPLLLMGGAAGAAAAPLLPGHDPGLWATVGMAALLGGTMRAPFTATVFALETTHNWAAAFPVFAASILATAVTVVWVPRSILTEKLARRGVHVAREYEVAPLERLAVREAMTPAPPTEPGPWPTIAADARLSDAVATLAATGAPTVAVVDAAGGVVGVVDWPAVAEGFRRVWEDEHVAAPMLPRRRAAPDPGGDAPAAYSAAETGRSGAGTAARHKT